MTDRLLRALTVAAIVGLGAAGLVAPDSVLFGGAAWLVFLLAVASGWGHLVARIAKIADPDLGLRAALGLAGYLAVAGPLLALGILNQPVIQGLLAVGVVGAAWHAFATDRPAWRHAVDALIAGRDRPALALLVVALAAIAILQIVGAIATLDRNPWDDDLAYTPFVKRLLDAGNLIEPFSFRRLGAYGGQTILDALAGARGTLSNVQLIDKGLCYAIALLALLGYARQRKTQPLWIAVVALVVLLLPDTAINTASYWSGIALIVALYRLVVDDRWALVGLVGGAACALRQNYIAVVVIFLAVALIARLWRSTWRLERRSWALVAGIAALVVIPYLIAAYRSSGTFLFPYIQGTWNGQISLRATDPSWADELQFLLWCLIETHPIVVIPSVFAVLMFVRDPRPGRPLAALFVAALVGLVLMAHSFVGADANHLWRYEIAAALPLLCVFALEIGAEDAAGPSLPPIGRWVLLASLLLQLVVQRETLPKRFATEIANIKEARHGDPSAAAERRRYAALQAAVPAGAKLLVMLDDPADLDFGRNTIVNLDTPGYASPKPGLPMFTGPQALRDYLLDQGIRYVAFVRSDRSRYFFRRGFWVWRLFNDAEIFQTMSAYTLSAIEMVAGLEQHGTVLHDDGALVALDLGDDRRPVPAYDLDEQSRRAVYVRGVADREGLRDAWSLTTRDDVLFEDGLTGLTFLDGSTDDPTWWDVLHPGPVPAVRGTPARWLYRRAHVRVRGDRRMQLRLHGKVNLGVAYTRPRIDVTLDGELLASVTADASGEFSAEAVVSPELLAGGWHDLYLVFGSIGEPQKDVRDLRTARLEAFDWEPQ